MTRDDPGNPDGVGLLDKLGPSGRSVYLALLGDTRYRRFFFASLSSSLGDWVGVLAILALTESIMGESSRATAFALSGVMVARVIPVMILGPVAGVYADRWDRKRTLIATDLGRAALMALIPFVHDFFQLFVATFFVEVLSMLFVPAKEATLPNIVRRERLVQANQLTLSVTYGTLPLGGVLFAAFVSLNGLLPQTPFLQQRPESVAIWANALTFLVSGLLFAGMEIPRHDTRRVDKQGQETNAWGELVEGLRFIATRPRVRALVGGVMTAAFAGGVLFALAKLFVSVVNAGQTGFGLLVAVTGTGMLVGLAAAVPVSARFGNARAFGPGLGVAGLFTVVTAFMPEVWSASAAAFLLGFGAGLAFVTGYTLLQESTGDELRGRAFAAFNTGVRLALFVSLVIAPAVVGVLGQEHGRGYQIGGVRITMAIGGLIALAGAAWSTLHLVRAGHEPGLALDSRPGASEGRQGLFIVFEGGEGAGKTTQLRLLRAAIEREGHSVIVTREPGGSELGERIRQWVLANDSSPTSRAEALLYAAARAQHAETVIRPALERGDVVLCDRYVDSSIAYQGVARGLGEESVEELNRWATGNLVPDVVILLDVDAAEGLQRIGADLDRLEGEGMGFHRKVNEAFRRRAAADPGRFLVVDASRAPEEVQSEIRETIFGLLQARQPAPAAEEVPESVPAEPDLPEPADAHTTRPTEPTAAAETARDVSEEVTQQVARRRRRSAPTQPLDL